MNPVLSVAFASLLGFCTGGCNSNEVPKAGETAHMAPSAPATVAASAMPAASLPKADATPPPRVRSVIKLDKPPTSEQARIARTTLASVFRQAAEDSGDANFPYSVAMADLNDDSRPDMIVHIDDYRVCGQWGCQGYAILATPTGFSREAIQLGVCFQMEIVVLPTSTKGMRDLRYELGGDADREAVTSRWDGRRYEGGCRDLE